MALCGTLVKEKSIKCNGDAFLDIFCCKPYAISDMCPHYIQGVDILDGEWGSVGSVIIWKFRHGGTECVAKEVIEACDMEKKLVCFKVIDGTLMDLYKSFLLTINVDTNGDEHLVTWTLNYEKLNENVHDPNTLMEFCCNVTKDIDAYQNKHIHSN